MNHQSKMNRRQFIISTSAFAGGMALSLSLARPAAAAFVNAKPWGEPVVEGVTEFNAWVSIAPDDTVTVRVPTPDIGNGVMTQHAMTLTEELQNDWAKTRAEFAPANRNYVEKNVYSAPAGNLGYFAGRSTSPARTKAMLQIGASARERLKAAAAQEWNVPVSEIDAAKSVLTHRPTGRKLRYGEVAAKAATIVLDKEPTPKPEEQWTFLGKASPAKLQLPNIVNGTAVYGIDVILPNMVYAALMQSPVHGGKLKSYDFAKIKDMPGVKAVVTVDPSEKRTPPEQATPFPLGLTAPQSAIAVIADHYWQARKALDALPVEWEDGAGVQWKSTEQVYDAARKALDKPGEKVEASVGNAALAMAQQPKVIEATYQTPYCDHVTMEPLNGTAMVTPDRVDVWHPSQHSHQGLMIASDETGVPPEKVFFNQTFVGGGFGRRAYGDDLRMVIAVARKYPGRPVKVMWSREESMRQGRYRALMASKFQAGLGADGMPKALIVRASGKGMSISGLSNNPYTSTILPNVQVESQTLPLHILAGPYRGPGYNSNAFFTETFIDECAHAANIDPLEYRLKLFANYPDVGWVKCLKEASSKAGWGKALPKGVGQGIAISNWGMAGKPEAGTTVCAVATVEVTQKGNLSVQAIDIAFDTGRVMNRDAVAAQIEGGVIFGLNMSLNENLTIKNGRIVEGNYDEYPMLRIGDVPKAINVHFGGLSNNPRYHEIGEPPAGVVGPAVGNAIFKATGKRLRSMPFRLHDLSWT